MHPRKDGPRSCGHAPGSERRAYAEERSGDDPALPRSPRRRGEFRRDRAAPRLHAEGPRVSFPRLSRTTRYDAAGVSPRSRRGRCARAVRGARRSRTSRAAPGGARARDHRPARSRRVLPHRVGHRRVLSHARHPRAGPRLRRQQRRLLRARHHRRRSREDGPALRALPLRGARRVAGHRPRSAEPRAA